MLEDMRIRNLAPNTQRMYLQYVSTFAKHFGRSPEELEPETRLHGAELARHVRFAGRISRSRGATMDARSSPA
jgi:hypothetical protein